MNKLEVDTKPYNGNPGEDRQSYLGGSDAGTILGINPYKSAYTLYQERVGKVEIEDISDKEAVWWGNYDEQGVALRFTEKTGKQVQKSNKTYFLKDYPFIAGHIDRKVVGENAGLECKTTSSWNKTDYAGGDIPPMHYAQCQHYMMVTGWDKWYIATKRDNISFYYNSIPRDEEYIEELLKREIEFWNMIQSKTPPSIDGSDSTTETIKEMYPANTDNNDGDDVLSVTSDISKNLEQLEELNKAIKDLENQKTAYENEIKAWLGNVTYAIGNGYKISNKSYKGKTLFDTDKFKLEHSDLYAAYSKEGKPYKRFKYETIKED